MLVYNKRSDIASICDVLIDGQYIIESQHDITLPWRGSANQRVINIQKSLQKGEIVLWQT
ncbi:MAG: radical SAM protein [Lachnospiraceae bacterium]